MAKENNKDVKNKVSFWKNFKTQLKKVVWPTPKQLATSTSTVIVIVLVVAAIVFLLDLAYESINTYGIYKIRDWAITSYEEYEEEKASEQTGEESATDDELIDGVEQEDAIVSEDATVSEDQTATQTEETNTTEEIATEITE